MKSLKITLFLLAILMALIITLSATPPSENEELTSRFLSQKYDRIVQKCDKNPKICIIKGSSAGPDCCNSKCVSLFTDRVNCGRCGKICCGGKCVNPMSNEKHCGKCGNKCDTGSSCVYGMCSYA